MFMSGKDYRESLGACKPSVYVNGRKVKSVARDAELAPGVNAIALTYDFALRPELAPLMRHLLFDHVVGSDKRFARHALGNWSNLAAT